MGNLQIAVFVRLAETTRTAEVVVFLTLVGKCPNQVGLVNIQIPFFSYSIEGLNAHGQPSLVHFYHNSCGFLLLFCKLTTIFL